ncbi:MAG: type II toxin-antitoxin system VapC family toxin [Verrucomicrobia bacterium]|nr:type II toxin-antitoxin system VapC family toxin [Verrucomicrobiota bacterium]
MIALDTNVLVRFLVQDDEKQAKQVHARLKKAEKNKEQLYVPQAVILETIWVLGHAYGFQRPEILNSIEALTQMPIFLFEADDVLEGLVEQGRQTNLDLSDLLIALSAENQGAKPILTFDRKAAKHSLFQLLK